MNEWPKEELPPLPPMAANGNYQDYAISYARMAVAAALARSGPAQWSEVDAELARATQKFPTWPTDPLHAVAVLGEEFGELTKAVLESVYEPHKSTPADVRTEAIQAAAMAMRFIASLDVYRYQRGEQHEQSMDHHPEPVYDAGSATKPK